MCGCCRSKTKPPVNFWGDVTPLKSHKNKNMNFKNIFGTKELGSFTIQSVSDCGRFVRFANGETTTRKHMEKNGGNTGAVAKSYDTTMPKVISLVRDADGVEFYMLHNEGTGVETIETL